MFSSFIYSTTLFTNLITEIPGPAGATTQVSGVAEYVRTIYIFFGMTAGVVALGGLVYGGVLYITSGPSPDRKNKAKRRIYESLIGLLLLFGATFILNTINPALIGLEDVDVTPAEPFIPGPYDWSPPPVDVPTVPIPPPPPPPPPPTPAPINGACGTAVGLTTSFQPVTGLCSSPVAAVTQPETATNWVWICPGLNGGSPSSPCMGNKPTPVPGQCGSSACSVTPGNCTYSYRPTSNVCVPNSAKDTPLDGETTNQWTWECQGSNGGGNAQCYSAKATPACGVSGSISSLSATSSNLCSSGTLVAGSFAGTVSPALPGWTWRCGVGSTMVTTVNCAATRIVCGNGIKEGTAEQCDTDSATGIVDWGTGPAPTCPINQFGTVTCNSICRQTDNCQSGITVGGCSGANGSMLYAGCWYPMSPSAPAGCTVLTDRNCNTAAVSATNKLAFRTTFGAAVRAGIAVAGGNSAICSGVSADYLVLALVQPITTGSFRAANVPQQQYGIFGLNLSVAQTYGPGCGQSGITSAWMTFNDGGCPNVPNMGTNCPATGIGGPGNCVYDRVRVMSCIVTRYLQNMAATSPCGCNARRLGAGYWGSSGVCADSTACPSSGTGSCTICQDGNPPEAGPYGVTNTAVFECPWTDPTHMTVDLSTNLNTRTLAGKIFYCYVNHQD